MDLDKIELSEPGPKTAAVIHTIAHSKLLGAAVKLVTTGIRTLPFGEPLAAAAGWMYERGVKVTWGLPSGVQSKTPESSGNSQS